MGLCGQPSPFQPATMSLDAEHALSQANPCELETIRMIDQRQTQVLDDLDRLNQRILDIIELYTASRPPAGRDRSEDQPGESPDPAVPAA